MTRKQEVWEKLIKYKRLDLTKKINLITARDIKEATGEEPRIMAKFDTSSELPPSFKKYGVFILPLKNKQYAIVKGTGFHNLEPVNSKIKTFGSRLPFELISQAAGLSEMQHIDYAYNSGLVEEFANKGNLYLTIRGRKYSPAFEFKIDGSPILKAESVQVEVDAGFEGEHNIVVIEGKIDTPSDFIIRQLYYPYRFWQSIIPHKKITPIFFTYNTQNKLYNFWEYRFTDSKDYESIELVRNATFKIEQQSGTALGAEDFAKLQGKKKTLIPQADDIRKILEFPLRVSEGMDNANDIAKYFEFNTRQSSYYREATEALGLVDLQRNKYSLTDAGQTFIKLPVQGRNELLARLIFHLPIMHEILVELLIKPEKQISKADIIKIIKNNSMLSGSTLSRRTQTVFAWLRWIQNSVGILTVNKDNIALNTKGAC